MQIFYTTSEGGIWRGPVDLTIQEINEYLYPESALPAILFPNGAIYDNVLASLGYFPWRNIRTQRFYIRESN